MLTRAIEVQKYCKASAGRANLHVVFENDKNQPRHDGSTIYLPAITIKTTLDDLEQLMVSVDHEVAHDKFSSFEVVEKAKLKPNSLIMWAWNALEDSRINRIEAGLYRGYKDSYDKCSAKLVENILRKETSEKDKVWAFLKELIYWDSVSCYETFPLLAVTAKASYSCNKKINDVLNNYTDRLLHLPEVTEKVKGTLDTFELAKDILKELGLYEKPTKEHKKRSSDSEKEDDSEKESVGDDDGGSKGKKESSSSSKEESDKVASGDSSSEVEFGKGEEAETTEYKVVTVTMTKEQLETCSVSMPRKMGTVGINVKEDTDIYSSSSYIWDLVHPDQFIVVNYPKVKGPSPYFVTDHISFVKEYETQVGSKVLAAENFTSSVRRLIQVRAKSQTEYGVKKGKLDQSRLSRVCFKAPGFSERVFKRQIKNTTLDTAVTLLVDMSGSMMGKKAFYALASTILLNDVCTTLGVPVEIVGFTDTVTDKFNPVMFVYKSFSDLKVSTDDLKKYFGKSSSFMAGNPDGDNILWAYNRLLERKEARRIFVVMSDGSPAASRASGALGTYTKRVIEEIEDSKKVDLFGLGICNPEVVKYYKHNSVITAAEEIPTKLIELIERKMI